MAGLSRKVPEIFNPSGVNHLGGLVPDPGAVEGTTKFLREDATWAETSSGGSCSVLPVWVPGDYTLLNPGSITETLTGLVVGATGTVKAMVYSIDGVFDLAVDFSVHGYSSDTTSAGVAVVGSLLWLIWGETTSLTDVGEGVYLIWDAITGSYAGPYSIASKHRPASPALYRATVTGDAIGLYRGTLNGEGGVYWNLVLNLSVTTLGLGTVSGMGIGIQASPNETIAAILGVAAA